jgi:uncharacterized repeat protein (TIGR01451 family)
VLPFAASLVAGGLACADPVSPATRARLAHHQPVRVIVEYEAASIEAQARAARARRGLLFDDAEIGTLRSTRYRAIKDPVRLAVGTGGVVEVRDLPHLPLAIWTLASPEPLARLEALPAVRRVHEDGRVRPVSITPSNDLTLIAEPQAATAGFTGAGTTIAVIDGGLVSNYSTFGDFGTCDGVTLGPPCRVVVNDIFYSGSNASAETMHGTNVAAIALGVAPGAQLAMFNVFQQSLASFSDILTAMDSVLADRTGANAFNYAVVNLSLGNGTTNATQCGGSALASAVTSLAAAGVTTVAAAGNNGDKTGLGNPACAPGVVSVGAVYNTGWGGLTWQTKPMTTCTDSSTAADQVTCFSQSANYLSLLAPGALVSAPSSAFQMGGTSQATPHVAGSVAVLRARYPAESLSQMLSRLQLTGVQDNDPAAGRATPRVNVYAAATLGTALAISGLGPGDVMANQTVAYTFTVMDSGPLSATGVTVVAGIPSGATFVSGSLGCTLSGSAIRCALGTLGSGGQASVTLNFHFAAGGPAFATASVQADQLDSTPNQDSVGVGTPPPSPPLIGDGPLPPWTYALLALALTAVAARRLGWRA